MRVDSTVTHILHHCQMFEIIVSLEESIPSEELNQDTTYAPDIARKRPAEAQNNLRGTIMPRRDDR